MRNSRRRRRERAQTGSPSIADSAPRARYLLRVFGGVPAISKSSASADFAPRGFSFYGEPPNCRNIPAGKQNGAAPRAGGTFCGSFKAVALPQGRIPPELRQKIFGIFRLRVEAYVYPLARMHGGRRRDEIRAELPELPDALERHASGNLRPRPAADEPYALGDVGV